METFPLFRLPFVALQEVLKSMIPFELVNFSMANQTTQMISKTFLKTKQNSKAYTILLLIDIEPIMQIFMWAKFYNYRFTTDVSKSGNTVLNNDKDTITMYSEDVLTEFKKRSEYVFDLFNVRLSCVHFNFDVFPSHNKILIDWITFKRGDKFQCFIYGQQNHDEMLSYVLARLNTVYILDIKNTIGEEFKCVIPNVSHEFYMRNGKCVNFPDFLLFNIPIIRIRKSKFTNQNMNFLLISWMKMESHVNLKYLELQTLNQNLNEIFADITPVQIDVNVVQYFRGYGAVRNNGGIDIRRADGATATIFELLIRGHIFFAMTVH